MNLNAHHFNQIGYWTVSVRIAALIGIGLFTLILGYLFLIKSRLHNLHAIEKQSQSLKLQYQEKYQQSSLLSQYQKQLIATQKALARLNLPLNSNLTHVTETISNLAAKNHLEIHSLKPEPENIQSFYVAQPISLSVSGDYMHLALFISELSALQKTSTFENFAITTLNRKANEDTGSTLLMMNATVTIHREKHDPF